METKVVINPTYFKNNTFKADRLFGEFKHDTNVAKANDELFDPEEMKKCFRKRCKELNKSSGVKGKYKCISCKIPVQGDLVKITRLEGITSSHFIRSTFKDGEQTSLSNYIDPWGETEVARTYTRGHLLDNQINIEVPRIYAKSRKLTTKAKRPENKKLNQVAKRNNQKRKRDEWKEDFSILILFP